MNSRRPVLLPGSGTTKVSPLVSSTGSAGYFSPMLRTIAGKYSAVAVALWGHARDTANVWFVVNDEHELTCAELRTQR